MYIALIYTDFQKKHICELYSEISEEFIKNQFLYFDSQTLKIYLSKISDKSNPYYKCWHAYEYVRNKTQRETHTKQLVVQKVRELQKKSGITNYRIYTDLKMNPGNVNAFLSRQDCTKVSLDTAWKILEYVEAE